jgi:retinoid hydroxylase
VGCETGGVYGGPPGSAGWPVVGELPAFVRNPFGFVESRVAQHGAVFRSRLLSEDVLVLAGPEGWERFADPAFVTREQALFPFARRLLGGMNLGMLDGPEHATLRSLTEAAFTDEALAAYMPTMQALAHDTLLDWSQEQEAAWIDGLQRLTLRTFSATMLGPQAKERLEALLRNYRVFTRGVLSLPVPLPFTPYGRALRAVERILDSYRAIGAEHRARPQDDGLTRMLTAEHGGRRLTDTEAARELHHFAVGGFITYGLLGGLVTLLARHPEVREQARNEVLDAAPVGAVTPALLSRMPNLRRVVLEAKRVWPVLPVVFGRARRRFTQAGYDIPPGHLLLMAVHTSNQWPQVYEGSARFDPERFSPARAEHERHRFGYAPHGAGPHRCPGESFATYLCAVFTLLLLRGYRWELVSPETELRWDRAVPEPRDGLRVRLEPLSG